MAVRNFWIEAHVDGRRTKLQGGPRGKDGGLYMRIYQRKEGGISLGVVVRAWAVGDKLILEVLDGTGRLVFEPETER